MAERTLRDFYKRDHWRDVDLFNQVGRSYNLLSKVILTLLVTPIVIVEVLTLQDFLLIFANIILALSTIGELVYKTKHKQVKGLDLIVNWLLLGIAIAFGMYTVSAIVAPMLMLAGSINLLFTLNIIAIYINIYSIIKSLLIPPLTKLVILVAKAFGFGAYLRIDPNSEYTLDDERDQEAINNIPIKKSFKEKQQRGNDLIEIMSKYKNKYISKIFGSIRYESIIKNFDDILYDITAKGSVSGANVFLTRKCKNKYFKIQLLLSTKQQLELAYAKAADNDDPALNIAYKNLLKKTTTISIPKNQTEMYDKHTSALKLFDHQITRQVKKFDNIAACLSKHLVTDIIENTTLPPAEAVDLSPVAKL